MNYADGYYVNFPLGTEYDFALAPLYTKGKTPEFDVTISREYATEEDVAAYIDHYLYRFLLHEEYQEANRIELLEDTKEGDVRRITVRVKDMEAGVYDTYTYVTIETGTKIFYNLMYKYSYVNYDAVQAELEKALTSFRFFRPEGEAEYNVDFEHSVPGFWSDETKAVYDDICSTDSVYWGIFSEDIYGRGIEKDVPALEEELDYDFSVILSYLHFGDAFPTEFMQKNYEDGKIVELTYQVTTSNNENLTGYTPMLDIYRGELDEEIRALAQDAKAFGHPFLFRLNNEMNSDWTSYSGVVNLCDPEVYVAVWQRIYNIFEEEGVDNAIWIYNPNDKAFPPCRWNNFLAFYPGDEYYQMIGITGYNTGTYYKEQNNEMWREFKNIYDSIEKEYEPFFDDYPWIITEFASSSVGGDKAKWMEKMFKNMDEYENVKIAVWFNYADYDPAYPGNTVVSRPYWLDETEDTVAAMRKGFSQTERPVWSFAQS